MRHYLMCPPTYFTVEYAINPWMDPTAPVDTELAMRQWETLKRTYEDLGHAVSTIEPLPGLPDMVFAANGATVVDGTVYGARFATLERAAEGPVYLDWFRLAGFRTHAAAFTNEGEGDLLTMPDFILAGTGFRTDLAAHAEAQELFGRPVITLDLVDPRYYHLDTALFPLDAHNIAYLPEAFSPGSQRVLKRMFPDAIIASPADGEVLGINAVSDGRHVVLNQEASDMILELKKHGYDPIPVDMSELRKAGGGPKCCTLEVRG